MAPYHRGSVGVRSVGVGVLPSLGSARTTPLYVFSAALPGVAARGDSSSGSARGGIASGQEGSGASRPEVSGLLRSTVRCAKGYRRLSSCTGLISSQPVVEENAFQNGNSCFNPAIHQAQRLGNFAGSQRRILPYSDPSQVSEVSEIQLARNRAPVSRPAVWPFTGPMGLHPRGTGHGYLCEVTRASPSCLPGRLAITGGTASRFVQTDSAACPSCGMVGLQGKSSQVRSDPKPRVLFYWHESVNHFSDCAASRQESGAPAATSAESSLSPCHDSEVHSISAGNDGVHVVSSAFGESTQEASSTWTPGALGSIVPVSPIQRRVGPVVSLCDPTVDRSRLAASGSTPLSAAGPSGALHGRLSPRLGGSLRGVDVVRHLVSTSATPPHQQPRVGGRLLGASGAASQLGVQSRPSEDRQHNGCSLHQQPGGGEVINAVPDGRGTSSLVSGQGRSPLGVTRLRLEECSSRPVEPSSPDVTHRVDPVPSRSSSPLGDLVHSDDRPLCLSVQSPLAPLRVACPRSSCLGNRCAHSFVERTDRLRVPPRGSAAGSGTKSKDRSSRTHSDRSSRSRKAVVSRPSGAAPRASDPPVVRPQVPSPAPDRDSSSESNVSPSPRLETVRTKLSASGASAEVSNFVLGSLRKGTNKVYAGMWRTWVLWSRNRTVDGRHYKPYKPPPMEIANFLAYLRRHRNFAPSYVKQHRSAINTTISQMGISRQDSACVSSLLKGMDVEEAAKRRQVKSPQWDVHIVLAFLKKPQFSLANISSKWLHWKTLFLVALATARRPCELHAFSALPGDYSFEADGSITLRFIPEFVAKTQKPSDPVIFTSVKPLASSLPEGHEDRELCPVAFLKAYLQRTSTFRAPSQRRVFISYNPGYEKDISRATLSGWVAKVVSAAYTSLSAEVSKPRAHELRAIATSLARVHSASMETIMHSAFWRRWNTFTKFYLRNVARRRGDNSFGVSSFIASRTLISSF